MKSRFGKGTIVLTLLLGGLFFFRWIGDLKEQARHSIGKSILDAYVSVQEIRLKMFGEYYDDPNSLRNQYVTTIPGFKTYFFHSELPQDLAAALGENRQPVLKKSFYRIFVENERQNRESITLWMAESGNEPKLLSLSIKQR